MAIRKLLILLVGLLISTASWPQDESAAVAVVPDPRALSPQWWSYLDEADAGLENRASAVLEFANKAVQLVREQNGSAPEETTQYLERLRLNLGALPKLKSQNANAVEPIPAASPEYTLDQYLQLEREQRKSVQLAQQLEQVIQRNKESARLAERQVDNLLAAYLALPPAEPTRLRRGLQIMASRSGLAVARQQVRVREANFELQNNRIEQIALLLQQAAKTVVATPDQLSSIETELGRLREELDAAQGELRDRQARALGVSGESAIERARSTWREQRVVVTSALESRITLDIARRSLEQAWISLKLFPEEAAAHLSTAKERLSDLADLITATRSQLKLWEEQAQRELQAVRSSGPEVEPELAKVQQQRQDAANLSLRNIDQAKSVANDAELIANLVQHTVNEEQGVVVGGFDALWQWSQRAWVNTEKLLGASLFKLGDTPVTTFGLLRVAFIVFIAVWISRLFRHALDRIGSRGEGTQSAFYTVGRLAHYVIIAAGILIGLASIGLSFANLAIVAGALGVGIGFGLQSIVNNFVSGLILLFERSLKVGDYVELESGVGGIVKEINVRSTLINTNQNLDILVPNSEFVSGRLTNWTLKDASRRLHIPFGVAYGTDKDLVKKAVLEAAETLPYTVTDNPLKRADVWLTEFGSSSLDFQLVVWIKQAAVRKPSKVTAAYIWAIETALGDNNIEIPFPQRDLHLRSGFKLEPATESDQQDD